MTKLVAFTFHYFCDSNEIFTRFMGLFLFGVVLLIMRVYLFLETDRRLNDYCVNG
jgi:hypothetical protein